MHPPLQAIGRCIRHRADWGAIVLLDSRFEQPVNQRGLSRWVRGSLRVQPSWDAAAQSLGEFFKRLADDPPRPRSLAAPAGAAAAAGGPSTTTAAPAGPTSAQEAVRRLPVPGWAKEDLGVFRAFLDGAGCQLDILGDRYTSMDQVAQDAVLDCFSAAL